MFSQTVEYALIAVVFLSKNEGKYFNAKEISNQTKIPPAYLSKILQGLSHSTIIESKRGTEGGYKIGRLPEEISVLEVVNLVDPIERIEKCPLNMPEHQDKLCSLHKRLDKMIEDTQLELCHSTIADIIAG
ncbi:MAG: Rrf2 family transcriptional regulator [Cyanobacteria bacterium TGS_CYA1]|nr:Rrf2 family transcriptional regulator [Cyanobacteria bacterium TGS_CYA1]